MSGWRWIAYTALLASNAASAAQFTIAPNGSDANPGTAKAPFATLERARDAIRALKQSGTLPRGGVTVEVRGGIYERTEPFALSAQDSGTAEAPILYQARKGEQVRLVGGKVLTGFTQVTDPAVLQHLDPAARGKVLQTNLRAQGITDLAGIAAPGWAQSDPGMELFFRDQPMTLARWPNEGYAHITDVAVKDGHQIFGIPGSSTGQFIYEGDRPSRWIGEKEIWLHGYWFWDWADQRQRVSAIDPEQHRISLSGPSHAFGYRKGQWYYALNLLCELDQPGEWYLDRDSGNLYFWPPKPLRSGKAMVSIAPGLVTLQDASYITLRGMTLESARGDAVTVTGGTDDRISGCTIRNVGKWGVRVSGGTNHGVVGCDIYQTGEGGISLEGGDRATLTAANHFADNNHVHHCCRWNPLYHPGITLNGVGLRATHNLIHDLPHVAIGFIGNDHQIEYNEIHSCVFQANDAGAIYTTGADEEWTMRGHTIRYNYLHHLYGFEGRGCNGVYLDDAFSSAEISGNLFYQVATGILIGGGRDNTLENNVFADCPRAFSLDARGLGWMAKHQEWLTNRLLALPYQSPFWRRRYPKLTNILEDEPMAPKGNLVARNICWGGKWGWTEPKAMPYISFADNLTDTDPRFADAKQQRFELQAGSPALKLGFQPLPLAEIGLYRSDERASWPVTSRVRPKPATAPAPRRVHNGPLPTFKVQRIAVPVTIDGTITAAEWGGQEKAMRLEQDVRGEKVTPPSLAWVAYEPEALLVAFDNQVDPNTPLRLGGQWGQDDAVEIAIRNPAAGKNTPILILRGYPAGKYESSEEAGASPAAAKQAAEGVSYKARIVDGGRWTAEWRIPFAALGIQPAKQNRFAFNLSVRKTAGDQWILWQGTGGSTWEVDGAGFLTLTR